MPPTAAHRRPPPETDSDTDMGIFRSKDRSQAKTSAPTAAGLQGKPFISHICQYLQSVVGPGVIRRRDPYLKDNELKKLGVRVTGLDLASGQAQPPMLYSDQFLKPIAPSNMEKWLGSRGRHNCDWLPLDGRESMQSHNFGEAKDVMRFFNGLLSDDGDSPGPGYDGPPGIAITHSPWRWDSNKVKNLKREYPNVTHKREWATIYIYRSTVDPRTSYDIYAQAIDSERPHIIASLAEDNKMKQGLAFTSEVQTIMVLAANYGARRPHRQHQLIPVTLLTGSWRTCRVVQGIVNLRTQQVELRISKNIDLEGGARRNWDKVLAILGWLIAEPVGRTM